MPGTTFQFEAIGTHWRIELHSELTPSARAVLEGAIMERIRIYDLAYSRFRDDSLVAEMARREGKYVLPPDGPALFFLYERVYRITGGKVTPLIGSVMEEAGYDKQYSLTPKEVHAPPSWDEVLHFDGKDLTLKVPALLDVGAAGKGYLIDLVSIVIENAGYHSYTIDAGGDIIHRSESAEKARIGLEHPLDTTKVIGVISLGNESICGSAGNRRAWGDFTHIIDPVTLTSPKNIFATWVTAESTILADMIATCLFFVPHTALATHFSYRYVLLRSDLSVEYSSGLDVEFF